VNPLHREALARMRGGIVGLLGRSRHGPEASVAMIDQASAALEAAELPGFARHGSAGFAACDMLGDIARRARRTRRHDAANGEALIHILAELHQGLPWTRNPNYQDKPAMRAYLANSASCRFIGPRGLLASEAVSLGFWMMGPGIDYPGHAHPAAETYVVLSGAAEWRIGERPVTVERQGSVVYHAPHEVHAMSTRSDHIVALFIWAGDLETPPALTT